MTIHLLSSPCWVLQWDGHPLTGDAAHYPAEADARADSNGGRLARHKNCGGVVMFGLDAWCFLCEDENIPDGDWELLGVTPAVLPYYCWVADCDCGCAGARLAEEEDGYVFHRTTQASMAALAQRWDYQVTTDLRVYPGKGAVPTGAVLLPLPPAEQEAAGQLTLDG